MICSKKLLAKNLTVLDPTAFGGTTTIVGDRSNIPDQGNFQTSPLESSDGSFPTSAGAAHHYFQLSHTLFHRPTGGGVSGGLGCIGSAFFSSLETARTSGSPGNYVTADIGNGDNGVVESGLNVGHTARDILFGLFGPSFSGRTRHSDCLKASINRTGIGRRLFLRGGLLLTGNG